MLLSISPATIECKRVIITTRMLNLAYCSFSLRSTKEDQFSMTNSGKLNGTFLYVLQREQKWKSSKQITNDCNHFAAIINKIINEPDLTSLEWYSVVQCHSSTFRCGAVKQNKETNKQKKNMLLVTPSICNLKKKKLK